MHILPLSGARAWCLGGILAALPLAAGAADDDWKQVSQTPTLTIYTRDHAGSPVKEVRAVGTFPVPNWVVKNVLDDVERYPQFMPHVVESRVISRTRGELVSYARVSPPMIDDRDYTIAVHDESHAAAQGTVYRTRWEPANDKGPAEKSGVVRIKNNEGSWLLEPVDNGERTRGTYTLWTDAGGHVPAFLLNGLNKTRLSDLFAAINKQVKDERYQKTKPVLP